MTTTGTITITNQQQQQQQQQGRATMGTYVDRYVHNDDNSNTART